MQQPHDPTCVHAHAHITLRVGARLHALAYSQVADSRVIVERVLGFGEGRGTSDGTVQHHIAAQAAAVSRCRGPCVASEVEALVRARVGVLRADKVGPEPPDRARKLELGFIEIHVVAVIPE